MEIFHDGVVEKMKKFAPIILRIGLSLVVLWFGTQQILNTGMWTSLIPTWLTSMSGIDATVWVHFNGAFEIVFGLCLLLGYFTRVTAFLLALHMLDITLTVGYTSVGVRDFGISMAMLAVFLHGMDAWSFDTLMKKEEEESLPAYPDLS